MSSGQENILILSTPDDVHAASVAKELVALGKNPVFLRLERVPQQCTLRAELGKAQMTLVIDNFELSADKIGAVWLRRPGKCVAAAMPEPWVETFIQWESDRAMWGLLRNLDCLWVNHPDAHEKTTFKVHQLDVARKIGFVVPETLITNCPVATREFFAAHEGELIYKQVDERSSTRMPPLEQPRGVGTLQVRAIDTEHFEQVRHCLHIFQRKVHKLCDLRITIIGKKIFPVEIDSQSGKGKIDWRKDYSVPFTEHSLPESLQSMCFQLARELGLNYAALDLCMDVNGEYVFFEANPAGQFLWLEDKLQLPLSFELALLLSGLAPALI